MNDVPVGGVKTLDGELYRDYFAWKDWSAPFTFGALDRDRFARDFRDMPLAGRSVLEIGFGHGALLAWARAQGADVLGCELTEESLAAARAADIPLVPVDFEATGAILPESLDIVMAFDVFEHLDEPTIRAKLQALSSALRPGGRIVLRYPNGQSPFGLIAQHGDVTHKVALSCLKIEQLAAGTGLRTVAYRGAAFAAHPRLSHRLVTRIRGVMRRVIIRVIHLAFATDVPLDPVMLHVLAKSPASR